MCYNDSVHVWGPRVFCLSYNRQNIAAAAYTDGQFAENSVRAIKRTTMFKL